MKMKRSLWIALYFVIYLILPLTLLVYARGKYPGIITWNLIVVSMIYLFSVFSLSITQLFTKWKSPSSIGIFVATIIYMNSVMGTLNINYEGTVIYVNLRNMLIFLYAILALKTALLICTDLKENVNRGAAEHHRD